MKSRKKRKRDRRRAEATVCQSRFKRGFGVGLPLQRSDLAIVRKSFREDWKPDQEAKRRAVREIYAVALRSDDLRFVLASLNTLDAGANAELRRLMRERNATESDE